MNDSTHNTMSWKEKVGALGGSLQRQKNREGRERSTREEGETGEGNKEGSPEEGKKEGSPGEGNERSKQKKET